MQKGLKLPLLWEGKGFSVIRDLGKFISVTVIWLFLFPRFGIQHTPVIVISVILFLWFVIQTDLFSWYAKNWNFYDRHEAPCRDRDLQHFISVIRDWTPPFPPLLIPL